MKVDDELSTRFPRLDQFSILHDTGKKFEFDPNTMTRKELDDADLSQRVTHALADEAFVKSPSPAKDSFRHTPPTASLPTMGKRRSPERKSGTIQQSAAPPSVPQKPKMVSIGTMTSPPSPPPGSVSGHPINRFPPFEARASSQPYPSDWDRGRVDPDIPPSKRSNLYMPDLKSKSTTVISPKSPASSRPSLESARPSAPDLGLADDSLLSRSRSANPRQRPSSVTMESRRDYSRPFFDDRHRRQSYTRGDDNFTSMLGDSETNISSDIDFLRAKEEEEHDRKKDKRLSSGSQHRKRTSLPSISLSGTKNLLAGRFGEAFRKFEGNSSEKGGQGQSRSSSPERNPLTLEPIAGSEATERSDDGNPLDETEEVSPEVRRELERRRLSQEEKRVADAAAEYRRRLTERGPGPGAGRVGGQVNRAVTIQNKVQSLLKENERPAVKTATGYGRFTDADLQRDEQMKRFESTVGRTEAPPLTKPTPLPNDRLQNPSHGNDSNGLRKIASEGQRSHPPVLQQTQPLPPHIHHPASMQDLSSVPSSRGAPLPRPTAPPKPKTLRTGQGQADAHPPQSTTRDEPSVVENPVGIPDDWETQFQKKYPALNRLEMVETEIGKGGKTVER